MLDRKGIYPALVLCRISFGLCLFFQYAFLFPSWKTFWGTSGLAGTVYHASLAEPAIFARDTTEVLYSFTLVSHDWIYLSLFIVMVLGSLMFAFGLWTRTSGAAILLTHTFLHAKASYAFWGWGELIKPFLFYLLLASPGQYFSVDEWKRTGRITRAWSQMEFKSWPTYLMVVHICTLYFIVAWARIPNFHWRDGSMLYRILSNSTFSRFPYAWEGMKSPLTWLGHIAWGIELMVPFFIWLKPFGKWLAVALILIHLGLEALANVEYWNLILIPCLLIFVPAQWLRCIFKGVPR